MVSDQLPVEYDYQKAGGGRLIEVREPNGNKLTITDTAITHSTGKQVTITRDGTGRITKITDPDGQEVKYFYDAGPGNPLLQLTRSVDRENRETTYTYAGGLLDEIFAPDGVRAVKNEYDADGRLVKHTDSTNEEVLFTHDVTGQSETVTDRRGNSTTYTYNEDGNVITQTNALGKIRSFAYDAAGNETLVQDENGNQTISTFDSRGNLLTRRDPLGNTTRFVYNARGLVTRVTDPLGRETNNFYHATTGNLLTTTNALLQTTTNTYDTFGRLTSTTDPLGTKTEFDHNTFGWVTEQRVRSSSGTLLRKSTFTYDGSGRQLTQTRWIKDSGVFVPYSTTTTVYDNNGRVVESRDALLHSTFTTYTANGQVETTTDKNGNVTTFIYTSRGHLEKTLFPAIVIDGVSQVPEETSTYDEEGNRVTFTDRNGNTTTTEYDALNRPKKVIHADGTFRETQYDDAGRVTKEIDERGFETQFGYDDAGRRTSVTDPLGKTTNFEFDAAGQQTAFTDALGRRTTFQYDLVGRQTKVTFADSTFRSTAYDAVGRRTSETDEAGLVTKFVYAPTGELVEVQQPDPVNASLFTTVTKYVYDEVGRKTQQIDALNRVTSFGYSLRDELVSRTRPMGESESFTYDNQGNLQTRTDFNGLTTTFAYNALNLVTSKSAPGFPAHTFTYFKGGQRKTATNGSSAWAFALDDHNRLASQLDPDGALIEWDYDEAGNRTLVRVSQLGVVSQEITYSWTARNELDKVFRNGVEWADYAYDDVGNRASLAYVNGTTQSLAYNSKNQLLRIDNTVGATVISSYAYTVDPRGMRTRVAEHTGRTVEYAYDNLRRLKQETIWDAGTYTSIVYTLDLVGNRERKVFTGPGGVVDTTYAYNANDELEAETTNGVSTFYAYDENGQTISKSGPGGTTGYGWDFDGRMVAATTPTESLTFSYDVDGIRWRKTVSGVATHFVVDRNRDFAQVLEERDAAGAIQRLHVWGDDHISQQGPEGDRFYHVDGQMSTRQLTDATASLTDTYTFDAFGATLAQTGTTPNEYLYAGEQSDGNVGFYYLRARYMNSATGRFVSQDRFAGFANDPISLHRYLYANADGANHRDPTGMFTLVEALAVLLILFILAATIVRLRHWRPLQVELSVNILFGSMGDPHYDVQLNSANRVFAQCNISFVTKSVRTWSEEETRRAIGSDFILAAYQSEGQHTDEELRMTMGQRHDVLNVYYVPAHDDGRQGESFPVHFFAPPAPAVSIAANAANSRGFLVVLAHEMAHVLGNLGHHPDRDNLMADGAINTGKGILLRDQCERIRSNALAK